MLPFDFFCFFQFTQVPALDQDLDGGLALALALALALDQARRDLDLVIG